MPDTDISDLNLTSGTTPGTSPTELPIRGEKRIIPSPVSPSALAGQVEGALGSYYTGFQGQGRTGLVQQSDFYIKAAALGLRDFITIKMANRGTGASGQQSGNYAIYRFLINPDQVRVSRSTIDGQAMARGGWQVGVWGEDSLQINLSGKTAGQYWSFGLTDSQQAFTESYRNLEQLQVVFENNGYFFEGETAGTGPLAANFTRRSIKMHADVQLSLGNFIWSGMFESFTMSQTADEPMLASFELTFIAWKERFGANSPYQNTIPALPQLGHSYDAFAATTANPSSGSVNNPASSLPPTQATPSTTVPLLPQAAASTSLPTFNGNGPLAPSPTTVDSVPTSSLLSPFSSQTSDFINGVM
jgi:hypothetical protein